MKKNADWVFSKDPLLNTVFSVHMYEEYNNSTKINDYIQSFVDKQIPLIVGEFADTHKIDGVREEVSETDIMERCGILGIGYIGWTWSGDNDEKLNIVKNWNVTELTEWGKTLLTDYDDRDDYSIAETSEECSIFDIRSDSGNPKIPESQDPGPPGKPASATSR